jgi:energy-coupling factor transporter ATP-binding protein EcfA2
MQKITSVTVENFRCFEKQTFTFEACHALVGENGSGKTAVLEAIDLAMSRGTVSSRIDEQDFHIADAGELRIEVCFAEPFLLKVPDGYTTKDVPCNRVVLSAHRRDKAASGIAFSGPIVAQQVAVPMEYGNGKQPPLPEGLEGSIPASIVKTAKGYELSRKTSKPMEVTSRQLSLQNDTVGLPNVFYFDRAREKESKIGFGSLLTKIARDLNWRFRKNWDPATVATTWEGFYKTVLAGLDIPKSDRLIDPLRAKMAEFLGNDFHDLELSLIDIEQPFSKAFFSRRRSTNQIQQGNFGSGVSILLAYFLLEIVSSLSKEQFIFLIDEPELHLHPQLQQRLFEHFRTSGFQVIYTTQSDIFVDVSEWRSISRFSAAFKVTPVAADLERQFSARPVSDHLDEIKKWHKQKSVYFREDNQLFFGKRCLLVEGPAEKYGVPVLASKLDLDLRDVTIISCNGKGKIPYYQLLCTAFGIPYFTLFDLDGKAETDVENATIASGAVGGACRTFTTSFERVLGVSANAEHKASDTFVKIDSVTVADMPPEIKRHITDIAAWSVAA